MAEKERLTDPEEHKRLASVVKNIHADLRKKVRANNGDFEAVWHQHCQDQSVLSVYAESMKTLAQHHWTKHSKTRIDWCRETINEYFLEGGLKKALEKEEKRQRHEIRRKQDEAGAVGTAADHHMQSSSLDHNKMAGRCTVGKGSCNVKQASSLNVPQNMSSPSVTPASAENADANTSNSKTVATVCSSALQNTDTASCSSSQDRQDTEDTAKAVNEQTERLQGDQEGEKSAASNEDHIFMQVQLPLEGKIRLLDVGSCYNPFLEFEEFLAIGVDISPATQSVHRCDFLELQVTAPLRLNGEAVESQLRSLSSPVESLPGCSLHAVVFSLLLEYLPAAYQRWLCCLQAQRLLQWHGLLVIVTPDSHSQHRNAPMMRSWKTAIEALGFRRWRYVKLDHLHCMAFRKLPPAPGQHPGITSTPQHPAPPHHDSPITSTPQHPAPPHQDSPITSTPQHPAPPHQDSPITSTPQHPMPRYQDSPITSTPQHPAPKDPRITSTPQHPAPKDPRITSTPQHPAPKDPRITSTPQHPAPKDPRITSTPQHPAPKDPRITSTPQHPAPRHQDSPITSTPRHPMPRHQDPRITGTPQHPMPHHQDPPSGGLGVADLWASLVLDGGDCVAAFPDMLYIPQDFSGGDEEEGGEAVRREEFRGEGERLEFFSTAGSELPGCLCEED